MRRSSFLKSVASTDATAQTESTADDTSFFSGSFSSLLDEGGSQVPSQQSASGAVEKPFEKFDVSDFERTGGQSSGSTGRPCRLLLESNQRGSSRRDQRGSGGDLESFLFESGRVASKYSQCDEERSRDEWDLPYLSFDDSSYKGSVCNWPTAEGLSSVDSSFSRTFMVVGSVSQPSESPPSPSLPSFMAPVDEEDGSCSATSGMETLSVGSIASCYTMSSSVQARYPTELPASPNVEGVSPKDMFEWDEEPLTRKQNVSPRALGQHPADTAIFQSEEYRAFMEAQRRKHAKKAGKKHLPPSERLGSSKRSNSMQNIGLHQTRSADLQHSRRAGYIGSNHRNRGSDAPTERRSIRTPHRSTHSAY